MDTCACQEQMRSCIFADIESSLKSKTVGGLELLSQFNSSDNASFYTSGRLASSHSPQYMGVERDKGRTHTSATAFREI